MTGFGKVFTATALETQLLGFPRHVSTRKFTTNKYEFPSEITFAIEASLTLKFEQIQKIEQIEKQKAAQRQKQIKISQENKIKNRPNCTPAITIYAAATTK